MQLSFWEIAEAVQASNDYHQWTDFEITGVEFDTRKIVKGSLFVPLKGVRDGHDFIQQAVENQAVATLWSHEKSPDCHIPYLKVKDSLVAMQLLATYYLQKIRPLTVAVTGSNGKTTTKDMIASVLSEKYQTHKTEGNYNNHIGVPYTVLAMPETAEAIVVEMGMDHVGEISCLSKIVLPDIAVITMIGESHIENLGSRVGIAQAKMEIVDGLRSDGKLIIPADEPLLKPLIQNVSQSVIYFGIGNNSSINIASLSESATKSTFTVSTSDETFEIPVMGSYNVKNALVAILVGQLSKLSTEQIKNGLANVQLTKNRTEWLTGKNGATILSDVYNANPTAMRLVLQSFSKVSCEGERIVVLGDMLALGKQGKAMHESMAEVINPEKIQQVFLYGTVMEALYKKLKPLYSPEKIHYYQINEKNKMLKELESILNKGNRILVKGSNGMKLNEVIEKLQK